MRTTRLLIKRAPALVVGLAVSAVPLLSPGQEVSQTTPASTSARQMTEAAAAFLASLTDLQRKAAMHPFTAEDRTSWSNVPMFVHDRPGVHLADLTETQRRAAHDLLRASTSSQGYQKLAGVIRLDSVHRARELERLRTEGPAEDERPSFQEEAESFGSGSYAIAVFGNPNSDSEWAWLIQGHHLGASFTVTDGRTGFTPLFLGATPLVLQRDIHAGWSALSHEATRGFELMSALSPEQQAAAIEAGDVPGDVLARVGRKDNFSEYTGLRSADMTMTQQRLLHVLVEEYVRNADFDAAEAQLDAIASTGWDELRFSWRGATDDLAEPFYYRVHGARILIEFAQGRANHVHTILRDPANDYGERWLGETFMEAVTAAERFESAVRAYEGDTRNR